VTKEVTYGKNEEKKSSTTFTQTIDGVIYFILCPQAYAAM